MAPGQTLPGPALGFPLGPEDLLVEDDGTPVRIDKAFSWEAPLAGARPLAQRHPQRLERRPLPDRHALPVHGQSRLELVDEHPGTVAMLADQDAGRRLPHPAHHLFRRLFSETVAYADLVLPDTTYLERWDCISLLDRPIGSAEGPADAIRQPVLPPDRDVRPFQDVLIDLGARLKLPGFVTAGGQPRYRDYADYIVRHERKPGIGPLAGWRGEEGLGVGIGAPNPRQLERYIANGCFWQHHLPLEQRYFKHANRAYLETAAEMGFIERPRQIVLQLYVETLQKFRLAAQGHGPVQPPASERERIGAYFDPLPIWYVPFEEAALDGAAFPLHAVTQRPMPMYHSWGSQNAWLRQIYNQNRLYVHRATAAALGIGDEDWVWRDEPSPPRQMPHPARSTASTGRRCGRGTPSASAPAPGRWRRMRRKRGAASCSTR